jgi:hypothetical protein
MLKKKKRKIEFEPPTLTPFRAGCITPELVRFGILN